jgi:hypothetical protein
MEEWIMDNDIRNLSNHIVEVLNGSPVPIEAKRLVLVELLMKVTTEANKQIVMEQNLFNGGNTDELSADKME